MPTIERPQSVFTGTITTVGSIADCTPVPMQDVSGFSFLVPAGVSSVTYYGCATIDGTYAVIDNVGTAGVEAVTASQWHAAPAELFSIPFVKVVSASGSGTATFCRKG